MKDYPCRFGEGCRKKDSGCNYVHPSEPNYQQSVQKKESQESRNGGPSPDRHKRFANATASNTTALPDGVVRWGKNTSNTGGPRKSSGSENNASSAWNFSGQPTANEHSTTTGFESGGWGSMDNNNASTSNGIGWSTGGVDSTWTNDDATVGWGATTTPRDDGGWGTGSSGGQKDDGVWGTSKFGGQKEDGAWGTGSSGGHNNGAGWGASNSGAQKDDGAWGTGNSGGHDNGGWGSTDANNSKSSDKAKSHFKDADSSKGWDQPTTSNGGSWGSSEEMTNDAQKDKGEGTTRGDIHMRDPSPQRKQDEPKPKSAQPIPRSPPKHPSESPAQTPLSPKYVSSMSAASTKLTPDLKISALEIAKPKGIPMKIKGAEGRRALHQSIIKHTKNAIIAYIEHGEAQTDLNRWKDTQMSTIYGHATRKTRKILDSERATFHRQLQEVDDTFQKEINALVNLPELSNINNKRKSNVLTKEVIAEYTQELQDWFKDLEIHKRLLTEGSTEEGEIADEKEEGEVDDSEEDNTEQRISELLQSGRWTWKKLTEVIEAMHVRYDSIQTSIYFDIFTCIEGDSRSKLRLANASLESAEQEETQDVDELSAVSEKIATTGKNLEQQTEGLARLFSEVAELEKKLEAVRVQTTQANMVYQLAGRLFGDFEQWKEDDNAQLTAITEQVKLLHLHQPATPSASRSQSVSVVTAVAPHSSRSTLESVSPLELIDPIRRLVIDAIHKELKLCFDNLRFQCMENQHKLETEMEEEAKRIMFKAEIVKNRLTPSRESSIHPVIPRSQSNIPLVAHSYVPH